MLHHVCLSKKLIYFIACVLLISPSIMGMHKKKCPVNYLPREIYLRIFLDLSASELACICQVSQKFNKIASASSLWSGLYQEKYGTIINGYKPKRAFVRRCIAEQIIDLARWSKEDIESLLEPKEYKHIEIELIRTLEIVTLSHAPLKCCAHEVGSFFITFYELCLGVTNTCQQFSEYTINKTRSEEYNYPPRGEGEKWTAAYKNSLHGALGVLNDPGMKEWGTWQKPTGDWIGAKLSISTFFDGTRNNYEAKCIQAVQSALEVICMNPTQDKSGKEKRGIACYKLCHLFMLGSCAQNKYMAEELMPAFHQACTVMMKGNGLPATNKEVFDYIASRTWEKDGMKGNLYLKSFGRILKQMSNNDKSAAGEERQ